MGHGDFAFATAVPSAGVVFRHLPMPGPQPVFRVSPALELDNSRPHQLELFPLRHYGPTRQCWQRAGK